MNPTIVSPLISAVVLADSISPEGVRLTTTELVYPRMILAELNTHRVFSKNSASSRAIPTQRMIKMIREHPAVPASWRMNQPGMQGYELAPEETLLAAQAIWLEAMEDAIRHAERMDALGIHKQNVNRLTEPFAHMKTVMTGVYWNNFYGLRDHHMADPTIEALAKAIREARDASTPRRLVNGEWHLPYVSLQEQAIHGINLCRKISAARCARTSYNNMDGKVSTAESDIALHDRLLVDQPIHASPAEHQATPDTFIRNGLGTAGRWERPKLHGNLAGWIQYRKLLVNENMDTAI